MRLLELFLFFFLASGPLPATSLQVKPGFFENERGRSRFFGYPTYRNGPDCPISPSSSSSASADAIHVAMTVDLDDCLCDTVHAVHSILKHASCPENVFFHILFPTVVGRFFANFLRYSFLAPRFSLYHVDPDLFPSLVSDEPLNYARTYLADILPRSISRVIYLDPDITIVDDIARLWSTRLADSHVIAAPEYCNANFTEYFTDLFWSDQSLAQVFAGRSPCYFSTGVMVMDLVKWRSGDYVKAIEDWKQVHKEKRIYEEVGSLPPFLLVFAGKVEPIEHRWNKHESSCLD